MLPQHTVCTYRIVSSVAVLTVTWTDHEMLCLATCSFVFNLCV